MKFIGVLLFLVSSTVSSSPVDSRIANGYAASLGQFPYQVGLAMQVNATYGTWCGGSLIQSRWVLTAAHCTHGVQSVTVYLGATDRQFAEVTYIVYNNDVIVHSNFDAISLRDDISLIRIPPTKYTPRIQPIKLPYVAADTPSTDYTGEGAIASGWGHLSDNITSVAEHLQWAALKIVSNDQCLMVYGSSMVNPSKICVTTVGGISTCSGDSGGPLVIPITGVQIGLVSFGSVFGCEKGYPIVFTRLTSYMKWIEINTNSSNFYYQ